MKVERFAFVLSVVCDVVAVVLLVFLMLKLYRPVEVKVAPVSPVASTVVVEPTAEPTIDEATTPAKVKKAAKVTVEPTVEEVVTP